MGQNLLRDKPEFLLRASKKEYSYLSSHGFLVMLECHSVIADLNERGEFFGPVVGNKWEK